MGHEDIVLKDLYNDYLENKSIVDNKFKYCTAFDNSRKYLKNNKIECFKYNYTIDDD